MIEAYGQGPEPLPITVATRSDIWDHNPRLSHPRAGVRLWLGGCCSSTWTRTTRPARGSGSGARCPATASSPFARGKNEYLAATPAESLPEVRRLWSGWVDRILDSGVDGLDIRVSAHGSLTDEPLEYGYDEPVVEEFRRTHGCDPDGSDEARAAIAGDTRAALQRLHARGEPTRPLGQQAVPGAHAHRGVPARPVPRAAHGLPSEHEVLRGGSGWTRG